MFVNCHVYPSAAHARSHLIMHECLRIAAAERRGAAAVRPWGRTSQPLHWHRGELRRRLWRCRT